MPWPKTVCSFDGSAELNKCRVPAWALVIQGIWAGGTRSATHGQNDAAGNVTGYGNLYSNLLDYVISPR